MSDQGQRMDEQVLNALALSVERVEPPPALRRRVLTAARRPAPMRLPLAAVAAIAVVALLAGLLMGNALRATPPQSGPQVSRFTLAGSGAVTSRWSTCMTTTAGSTKEPPRGCVVRWSPPGGKRCPTARRRR